MTPLPPDEAKLTRQQRLALKRIAQLSVDHFHRALLTFIYRGDDQKLHVQVISTCNTDAEQIDMARRTLQQVEKSTTGLITTLTPEERRIVE